MKRGRQLVDATEYPAQRRPYRLKVTFERVNALLGGR